MMKLSSKAKRNILISPVVLLVRAPLILPFVLLGTLNELAQPLGHKLDAILPGFHR